MIRRSSRSRWELVAVSFAFLLVGAVAAQGVCLDWPLGADQVPGKNITIQQNYANQGGWDWYDNRPHAGADIQYISAIGGQNNGQYSANRPVYAAADGTVVYDSYINYPGHVVVIQHADGLYTMYGHIDPDASVYVGADISRGERIGVIHPWPPYGNDNYTVTESSKGNSHVHFEVRDSRIGSQAGPGYAYGSSPSAEGWLDPVQKIFAERSYPESVYLRSTRTVRSSSSIYGTSLGTTGAGNYQLNGIETGSTSTYPWWFSVSGGASGYINAIQNNGWGSSVYFGHIGGCGSSGGGGGTDNASPGFLGVPGSLTLGYPTAVTVRVTNTGTSTWYASDPVRLAATGSNTVTWSGWQCNGYSLSATNQRSYLCHDVAPGQSHDFNFSITANSSSTAYFSVQMVRDGVAFFGAPATAPGMTVGGGGGSATPVGVTNAGMESATTGQYGAISSWGPSGGWAYHSGFPASNNGSLSARFGFYSADTTETVGQVLSERFATNTTYTFKSWAIGGGNRTGVVPYQIGYAATDGQLGSFQLLRTGTANVTGNQGWVETPGVTYTTGSSGSEIGRQLIIRFGDGAAGGVSDIWFDNVTVTKQ